jgi:MFS superfamily sulfate permease-like transporter
VFLIIKHTTFPNVNVLGNVPGTTQFKEVSKASSSTLPGILIVRIEEPLYFANVAQIKRLFARVEKLGDPKAHPSDRLNLPPTKAVIIHMRNVISIDASAVQTLEEMVEDYERRHIHIMFVKLRDHVRPFLMKAHIITEANAVDRVFEHVDEAVRRAQQLIGPHDMVESGQSLQGVVSAPGSSDSVSSSHRVTDMSQVELE